VCRAPARCAIKLEGRKIVKGRLLALTVTLLLLVGVAPAAADTFGSQSAGQSADSSQSATSGATSTQIDPSNENISVRVLSPGNNGPVTQSNNSSAKSGALNQNATQQAASQIQSSGGAAAKALQEAAQWAGNDQSANSTADSTQKHPSNENISVRVLSPGDDGAVDQSNNSEAKSFAGNKNQTKQQTEQSQNGSKPSMGSSGGSCGCDPVSTKPTRGVVSDGNSSCGCDSGSKAIQAAGQDAANKQDATSDATSKQIAPSNENIPTRVLSPGGGGSVDQSNNSDAESFAGNVNQTMQALRQIQGGGSCSCQPVIVRGQQPCCTGQSTGIQAAGQDAANMQDAMSSGKSEQIKPENQNDPLRVKHSDGSDGDMNQSNNSSAESKALNLNWLWQALQQLQGVTGGEAIRT
jgi:hypothetical protein